MPCSHDSLPPKMKEKRQHTNILSTSDYKHNLCPTTHLDLAGAPVFGPDLRRCSVCLCVRLLVCMGRNYVIPLCIWQCKCRILCDNMDGNGTCICILACIVWKQWSTCVLVLGFAGSFVLETLHVLDGDFAWASRSCSRSLCIATAGLGFNGLNRSLQNVFSVD